MLISSEPGRFDSSRLPVRVVSEVIDRLDMDVIIKKYKGGGSSSYHPGMLLEVLI